jgi:hypothetical protein
VEIASEDSNRGTSEAKRVTVSEEEEDEEVVEMFHSPDNGVRKTPNEVVAVKAKSMSVFPSQRSGCGSLQASLKRKEEDEAGEESSRITTLSLHTSCSRRGVLMDTLNCADTL